MMMMMFVSGGLGGRFNTKMPIFKVAVVSRQPAAAVELRSWLRLFVSKATINYPQATTIYE